jgi:hypothetical protein
MHIQPFYILALNMEAAYISVCIHPETNLMIKNLKTYTRLEIRALLGYYAASKGNTLPTFRENVSVPSSSVEKSKTKKSNSEILDVLNLEDGTDMLSRNVGKKLPLFAA